MSDLARRSGVGKGTLSNLEAGAANPTIETLWALATALNVPFGELLAPMTGPSATVVRRGEGTVIEGGLGTARLLDRVVGGVIEIYELDLPARHRQESKPHGKGVFEQLYVVTGRVTTGPLDCPANLNAGDFVTFAADVPHVYATPEAAGQAILLVNYPASANLRPIHHGHRRLRHLEVPS